MVLNCETVRELAEEVVDLEDFLDVPEPDGSTSRIGFMYLIKGDGFCYLPKDGQTYILNYREFEALCLEKKWVATA